MEPGWQGLIIHGSCVHLVNITERVEGRLPEYSEVREQLMNDFNRMRIERAKQTIYEGTREEYVVEIDESALAGRALEASGS